MGTSDVRAEGRGLSLIVETLNASRKFILICAVLGLLAALVWSLIFPRQYRATTLVTIVTENRGASANIGSVVGQLGAIGSLAGAIGIGNTQRPEPLAVLQSRSLTEKYIADRNLLPELYWRRWDESTNRWKVSFFAAKTPTLWFGSEKFKSIRKVEQDSRTGLVSIAITWRDAKSAAAWANDLVKLTNEIMRQRDMVESERNLAYLTTEATKTDLVEVRRAISTLMESEIKRVMLAKGTEEYALKTIDPAVPPEEPSAPGMILSLLIGALAGFVLGCLAVYYRAVIADDFGTVRQH